MSFIKSVQNLLKRVGNEKIIEIKVARTPLSKILSFFLNLTSMGQFQQRLNETPYDKLYHLFMIVKTEKGSYIVEKNEVIIIKKFNGKTTRDTEILEANLREGLTLNIILEKTKNNMGNAFFLYKGQDNNCQFFINQILKSNGLNTDELEKFVLQNTRTLFQNNPRFRKIVNTITDIGAIATTSIDEVKDTIDNEPKLVDRTLSFQNDIFKPLLKTGFQNSLFS